MSIFYQAGLPISFLISSGFGSGSPWVSWVRSSGSRDTIINPIGFAGIPVSLRNLEISGFVTTGASTVHFPTCITAYFLNSPIRCIESPFPNNIIIYYLWKIEEHFLFISFYFLLSNVYQQSSRRQS